MKLTKKQKSFLNKVVNGAWSINPHTGLVDVDGYVSMSFMNLTKIPVKFGKVSGNFFCSFNKLTSLKGAPQLVEGVFYIKLDEIDISYFPVIIPQIEELIEKGIKLHRAEDFYYPYKETYYNNKIVELL
jgi:hypothetical protein